MLQQFFEANRLLVYCLYGQVFFLQGVAIALCVRRDSVIPLARALWLLSAFAFLHALYEWSYVVLPIQRLYLTTFQLRLLEIWQRPLEALSFLFLFQFGAESLHSVRKSRGLRYWPGAMFIVWAVIYIYFLSHSSSAATRHPSTMGDLWARYLLCFPGAVLTGIALLHHVEETDEPTVRRSLVGAALVFFLYAMVAGLLFPPADFFPAAWLNRRLLSAHLGIPPPMVRALVGVFITFFVIRSLKIFDLEVRRHLETSRRDMALTEERERISRDLHDGTLQRLYGTGLELENALESLPENGTGLRGPIRAALDELKSTMREIRSTIFDLNQNRETNFTAEATKLLEAFRRSDLHVSLSDEESQGWIPNGNLSRHMLQFLQEAMANVQRHAGAREVKVTIARRDGILSVCVNDNGIGFVPADHVGNAFSSNRGLSNMARRAELLGGKCYIDSRPGGGTKVTLTVPLTH